MDSRKSVWRRRNDITQHRRRILVSSTISFLSSCSPAFSFSFFFFYYRHDEFSSSTDIADRITSRMAFNIFFDFHQYLLPCSLFLRSFSSMGTEMGVSPGPSRRPYARTYTRASFTCYTRSGNRRKYTYEWKPIDGAIFRGPLVGSRG